MGARRDRALAIAEGTGAKSLVVAGPSLVTWLTGFVPEIETGSESVPALSARSARARPPPRLVVSDDDVEGAAATGCEVAAYPGFGIGPIDPSRPPPRTLREALEHCPGRDRRRLLPGRPRS